MKSAASLVKKCLQLAYFEPNDDGIVPIPFVHVKGKGSLVVVVGENASGKSFVRRILTGVCGHAKVEAMPISMEGRKSQYMGSLVYGDEGSQATGVNSARTVSVGIRTSRGRTNPHVIIWDEPDIGLADGAAAGVGEAIRAYMESPPETLIASVVISHSKSLISRLEGLEPHYLCVGDVLHATLKEWLDAPMKVRSIEDIETASHTRFKLIQKVLRTYKIDR